MSKCAQRREQVGISNSRSVISDDCLVSLQSLYEAGRVKDSWSSDEMMQVIEKQRAQMSDVSDSLLWLWGGYLDTGLTSSKLP